MRYYLSGPMSGLPDNNFPAFAQACEWLRARGFTIVSPHEKGSERDTGRSYLSYLKEDTVLLAACDALILLGGWTNSTGARMELELALTWKFPIFYLSWHSRSHYYVLVNMTEDTLA